MLLTFSNLQQPRRGVSLLYRYQTSLPAQLQLVTNFISKLVTPAAEFCRFPQTLAIVIILETQRRQYEGHNVPLGH